MARRNKKMLDGSTVSIHSPADGLSVDANANGDFQVIVYNTVENAVDGMLMDDTTEDIYLPYNISDPIPVMVGEQQVWQTTMDFNTENCVLPNDSLYMYAYDTSTQDPGQANYTQVSYYNRESRDAPSATIEHVSVVDSTPGGQNITVRVNPSNATSGFVFLILRENDGQDSSPIVLTRHLNPSTRKDYTFWRVNMDHYTSVHANVVVRNRVTGGGHAGKPTHVVR